MVTGAGHVHAECCSYIQVSRHTKHTLHAVHRQLTHGLKERELLRAKNQYYTGWHKQLNPLSAADDTSISFLSYRGRSLGLFTFYTAPGIRRSYLSLSSGGDCSSPSHPRSLNSSLSYSPTLTSGCQCCHSPR